MSPTRRRTASPTLAPGQYPLHAGATIEVTATGAILTVPGEGTEPPINYTLTVTTDGNGGGVVTGGGSYPAGTLVTPTATPNPGSTFTGWSEPIPILMDAHKTVTGTFTLVPTGGGEPPSGYWETTGPAPDALWSYGFQSGAVDTQRKQLHCYWPTGNGKVGSYDLVAHTWQVTENGANGPGANSHNASSAYDALNDRVWFSSFGPQYGPPGAFRWNPEARVCEHYDQVHNPGWASIDCAMLYDPETKAIFSVGGYSDLGGVVGRLPISPRPESASAWQPISTTGGPDFPHGSIGLRLTYTRAGISLSQRRLWLIDDAGDLLTLPIGTDPGAIWQWQRHAVTGPRPPVCTVYALDVPSNAIVGWAARDSNTGITYAQTWMLDLSTLTWRTEPGNAPHGTEASTSGYTDHDGRAVFVVGVGATYVAHWMSTGGTPPDGGGGGADTGTVRTATTGTGSGQVVLP